MTPEPTVLPAVPVQLCERCLRAAHLPVPDGAWFDTAICSCCRGVDEVADADLIRWYAERGICDPDDAGPGLARLRIRPDCDHHGECGLPLAAFELQEALDRRRSLQSQLSTRPPPRPAR